jgi:hypothetical protein
LVDNVFFSSYYKSFRVLESFTLLSDKNIFKIEIHSLPVRTGGASFYFAQNDIELSRQTLRKPCHSEGSPKNLILGIMR